MPTIRSIRNQYRGVNAHLHSHFQANGGWDEFHTQYIVALANALKLALLPLGYTVGLERSIQIRRFDGGSRAPEADILVYDPDPVRPRLQPTARPVAGTQELVLTLEEALPDTDPGESAYRALGIFEWKPERPERGEPIVWMEVLSPSNKPGGSDHQQYLDKREFLIEKEVVFVEVDFLHESAPTWKRIARYYHWRTSTADPSAHPYHIAILDPRPDRSTGTVRIREFDVDEPIPALDISLNGPDSVTCDFGGPYQAAYAASLLGLEWVDYAQLPARFDRYNQRDQTRIVRRMVSTLKAHQQELDLESGEFPVGAESLNAALSILEQLRQGP